MEYTRWRNSERLLVATLAQLPNLAVLGLKLRVNIFSAEHLEFLDQHLPVSLTTFVYGASYFMDTSEDTTKTSDWLMLVSRSHLSREVALTLLASA